LLEVAALGMWDYEIRIGAHSRAQSKRAADESSNARRWKGKEMLGKVAERLALMERSGQAPNVSEAVRRVGRELKLSDTEVRNLRTLWYRTKKKLLPSAGQ
jgi:hypothetical protein